MRRRHARESTQLDNLQTYRPSTEMLTVDIPSVPHVP
jgi:hypothetical protein